MLKKKELCVAAILILVSVGMTVAGVYQHQAKVKTEAQRKEMQKHVKRYVSVFKIENWEKELNTKLKKIEVLYKNAQELKQKVSDLFKGEKRDELAEQVTRELIDSLKKQIEEKNLEEAVKTDLQKDIEKAYELFDKKEQEAEKACEQAETIANSGSSSNSGSNSENSNSSTEDGKSENAGDVALPIVAQMNLSKKTNQIITVVASGTSAKVTFWQKSNGGWGEVFSTNGQVGSQGIGSADEYHSRTPRGAYSLGFAFGTNNPGTSLNFRQITNRSYWISNVDDPDYNTWQERDSSSSKDEHMASYPTQYQYGVVINYNTACVKGGGSAFFLHCGNGAPTAGCVAIPTSYMRQVLQQLHSGAYIVNVRSEQELLNY